MTEILFPSVPQSPARLGKEKKYKRKRQQKKKKTPKAVLEKINASKGRP